MAEAAEQAAMRILESIAKRFGMSEEDLLKRLYTARQELGDFIRKFYYETPEGKAIRLGLSLAARQSGYARRVKNEFWTKERREEMKRIAQETHLGTWYRSVWGTLPVEKEKE